MNAPLKAVIHPPSRLIPVDPSAIAVIDPGFALSAELRALDAQLAEEIRRTPLDGDRRHQMFLVKLGVQLRALADQALASEVDAALQTRAAQR